jgi:predicted nucleic-acid-binding protein
MIAVDTNIIIRLLTHDDEGQFDLSYRLIEEHEVFIPDSVVLESEWVLRYAYGFAAGDICDALTKLFGLPNIHLANPTTVSQAIGWHRQGLDFADALHLANSQRQRQLFTFDRRFIGKAAGLGECSVLEPPRSD